MSSIQITDSIERLRANRRKLVLTSIAILVVMLAALGLSSGVGSTDGTGGATRGAASEPGGGTGGSGGERTGATGRPVGDAAPGEGDEEEPDEPFDGFFNGVELASSDELADPDEVDLGGDAPAQDPCQHHDPAHGALLVTPDPAHLADNDMVDELTVRNCGDATVDWTALTVPKVSLGDDDGTLAAGQVTTLPFTIDGKAFAPGAIDFKIKVQEPGHSHYVDVHAFRQASWVDYSATDELSAGPDAGGCAMQCITKAQLSSGAMTPNVGIDIAVTVPATVRVYVSTNLPALDQDGNPYFVGQAPKATSPAGVTTWKTSLTGLQAATTYNIIVKATDGKGDTAYRSGKFKTITPATGPATLAGNDPEPGCSYQCITKAKVTPGEGLAAGHISVASHTPARFDLWLSTSAPIQKNGKPAFEHVEKSVSSGAQHKTSWEQSLSGLAPGTKYHAILQAEDANGKSSHVTGSFTTDGVDVAIALHQIHITQDGDTSNSNRGELSFSWAVGDSGPIGVRDEEKLHHNSTVTIGRHNAWFVNDAGKFLPTVRLAAFERDADLKVEFCAMGTGVPMTSGSNGDCDVVWNVATSGIVSTQSISGMPKCSSLGVGGVYAGHRCMVMQSEDLASHYPEFWTIVSFDVQ